MNVKKGIAVFAAVAMSVTALAGCGSTGGQSEAKPDSISFWYYENDASAETVAWKQAAKEFTKDTGIKVKFEVKSFTQIAQNASQFLNSDQAPDIMESNRGNGSAGMLSSMGLLSDMGPYVKKYGWDKEITPGDASVAKYNDKGIMNGDKWVGLPTYAEYQRVFYNKDLFAKYGIKIPATMDEFEDACAKFKAAGVTPIAADAQEYGVLWLWWSLVGTKADERFIEDWHMYKHDVNWNAEPLTYATNKINEWLQKGYISRNATGLKGEDTTVSFIKGENPIYQTGTWNESRFNDQIKAFDWDAAVLPGTKMLQGCTGNLLVIPEKSKHKDWSAKLLDKAISKGLQTGIGNAGSVPLNADMSKVINEKNKKMIEEYSGFSKKGQLSYYPDYPASNLTDAMSSEFQELTNGTKTPTQTLEAMKKAYNTGVQDMGVKDN
ncbi:carbohydrate ABC transporter substrate-binding protein, CUT1 family [Bifidobacterium bohemicum]|uniref:ABC transporter, solute-binding protein n=1 Tax=Bifidobacterium bohemicum DSM 22767 TaxID=1437606 RepID=A0A086ZF56_9BIFI|nr:extracellular solute-binding protein [Bifidobacterium bohemicum]KFI45156.1 ABC transporter, solute-binding protein [Bifidobacterium bohemicum DSM 22767]SCB90233.1 carbohydrate ABC transporter substrate-binding protein, CUT1 family [Bifidobacterium bohemicum]